MRDLFEELLNTLENNALDNKITITDVKNFVRSWREERESDIEEQLFSMTLPSVRPKPFEMPNENDFEIENSVVMTDEKFSFILQNLEGHFVNEVGDMLNEYGLTLRVVKRDGIDQTVIKNDGIDQILIMKIDNNRINVEIENGIITKVNGRG